MKINQIYNFAESNEELQDILLEIWEETDYFCDYHADEIHVKEAYYKFQGNDSFTDIPLKYIRKLFYIYTKEFTFNNRYIDYKYFSKYYNLKNRIYDVFTFNFLNSIGLTNEVIMIKLKTEI